MKLMWTILVFESSFIGGLIVKSKTETLVPLLQRKINSVVHTRMTSLRSIVCRPKGFQSL